MHTLPIQAGIEALFSQKWDRRLGYSHSQEFSAGARKKTFWPSQRAVGDCSATAVGADESDCSLVRSNGNKGYAKKSQECHDEYRQHQQ